MPQPVPQPAPPTAPAAGSVRDVVQVVATRSRTATVARAHIARPRPDTRLASTSRAPATSVARLRCPRARPRCGQPATTCKRPGSTPAQARAAALQTARIVKLCFRAQGKASCAKQVDDAEEAAIRADAAAAQVSHVENVVQHLLGAIAAFVAPVREQATRTFTSRVEKAQTQFGEVREQVRSDAADVQETSQDQWSVALSAYRKALDKAGTTAHKAADERLREVQAYAKDRQATVRKIQYVYEQKLRSGNVAAARAYRKQALADLAKTDSAFAARIGAERDRAAAAYETATGVAKQELDRVRALVTKARAAAGRRGGDHARPGQGRAHDQGADRCRRTGRDDRRRPGPCRGDRGGRPGHTAGRPGAHRWRHAWWRRLTGRRQSAAASSTSTSIGAPSPAVDQHQVAGDLAGGAQVASARLDRGHGGGRAGDLDPRRARRASTTLACDLAPRMPASAAATASSIGGVGRGGGAELGRGRPRRVVDRALLPPRPDLLGHVGQERREQPQLDVQRERQRGLGRARPASSPRAPYARSLTSSR